MRTISDSQAVAMLGALAQDTRLRIFRELVKAHDPAPGRGGLAAGVLGAQVKIAASTLSFHLKEMSQARLITSRKHGRSIVYRANLDAMRALVNHLLHDCCGGSCGITINELDQHDEKTAR